MGYDDGETIFLVEEPGVPNYARQATIAEDGPFIQGFKRYFDLVGSMRESSDDAEIPQVPAPTGARRPGRWPARCRGTVR